MTERTGHGSTSSPPPPNRLVVAAVSVGIVALIAMAVFALVSLHDDTSTRAPTDVLGAVRSNPKGQRTTFQIAGQYSPVRVVGGVVLMADINDEGTISQLKAIDLVSRKQTWRHAAQSMTTVGPAIFVVDDTRLEQLDAAGDTVGPGLAVEDGTVLGAAHGRLLLYGSHGVAVVDPTSMQVIDADITPASCSQSGRYCTRVTYATTANTSQIRLVDLDAEAEQLAASAASIGTSSTIAGSPTTSSPTTGIPTSTTAPTVAPVGAPRSGPSGPVLTAAGRATSFATDDGTTVVADGSDLVAYSRAGRETSRLQLATGTVLSNWFGDIAITTSDGGVPQALSTVGKLRTLGGPGPAGVLTRTSSNSTVVDATATGVRICRIDVGGFTCGVGLNGMVSGVADGVYYLGEDTKVHAYDIESRSELWSLSKKSAQTFVALDGKVALFQFQNGGTTVDVYG